MSEQFAVPPTETATAPPAAPAPGLTEDEVTARINAALAERDAAAAENLRVATGAVPLPKHAAGPGFDVADSWGLADQLAAQAAEDANKAG